MLPAPKGQIPAIARNNVDLPEPDGPERTTLSPSASTRCFVSTARLPSGRERSTLSRSILAVLPTLATRFGPASLIASASVGASSPDKKSPRPYRFERLRVPVKWALLALPVDVDVTQLAPT
jgi:hypothetical protein